MYHYIVIIPLYVIIHTTNCWILPCRFFGRGVKKITLRKNRIRTWLPRIKRIPIRASKKRIQIQLPPNIYPLNWPFPFSIDLNLDIIDNLINGLWSINTASRKRTLFINVVTFQTPRSSILIYTRAGPSKIAIKVISNSFCGPNRIMCTIRLPVSVI